MAREERLRAEKASRISYVEEPKDEQTPDPLRWSVIDRWQTHPGFIQVLRDDERSKELLLSPRRLWKTFARN